MLGRLAATALAAALLAPAAHAAPQALRGSMPAEAAAPEVAPAELAAPAPRRAKVVRRRHAPAPQDAPALLAVPANGAAVVVEQPVPLRRSRARRAAVAAVESAVPVEQVEVSTEAAPARAGRRRARTRAAAVTAATESVEVPAVAEEVDAAPRGSRASRRRGRPAIVESVAPSSRRSDLDARIDAHAKAAGVPATLVHHVITRESRYNPGAVGRGGVYGLMQIKHGTARALGYTGSPSGLLDPDTNLTYGVRYLAGAYKVANGNPTRAYSYFRSGYYYAAKRAGGRPLEYPAVAQAPAQTTGSVSSGGGLGSVLSQIFASPAAAPAR